MTAATTQRASGGGDGNGSGHLNNPSYSGVEERCGGHIHIHDILSGIVHVPRSHIFDSLGEQATEVAIAVQIGFEV